MDYFDNPNRYKGHYDLYSMFSECVGNVVYGPKVFSKRTRNPFNRGGEHNAWLVNLDVTKMPGCVNADQ